MASPAGTDEVAWRSIPTRWCWGDLVAVATWSVALIIFFREVVFFRGALFYFDIIELNYPYRDFLARELRQGRWSRWFPGVYCGLPLFSESQAGYLHPLKYLLYPWMETWKAFNLDTVGSVWLTGLGTYGWLRRHVGPRGALTGAAVFGLSGFVWAHLIHTSMNNALTSVPYAVWALEWAWSTGNLAGVALGAMFLAFQVFAGHLQDTLLTAGLLAGYGLYRALTEPRARDSVRALLMAGALIALGVLLASVQWIPSKELLDRSPRAGGLTYKDLTYGSWHPELLPTLVVREAYGTRAHDTDWMDGFYPYHEMNAYLGLTAMALAVVGAASFRDRWVAFWFLIVVLGGVLMLGKHTFLMDYANRIPIAGSSRIPVRFHLWVSLAVAALAAVGVDRLGRSSLVNLRAAYVFVGFLVVASIPIMLAIYHPAIDNPGRWNLPYHVARYRWLGQELVVATIRTLLLTTAGLAVMATASRAQSVRWKNVATAVLPVVVIADLLGAHWHDVPTVDPTFWTKPPASATLLRSDPGCERILGIAEKHAGEPGYASERVDFLSVRDTLAWSLPPVWGLRSAVGQTPIIPRRLLRFTDTAKYGSGRFDLEAVTHVVTGRRSAHTDTMLGPGQVVGAASIHRVPTVRPRVRFLGRPAYAADELRAASLFDELGGETLDRVIVEDPSRPLAPTAVAQGTVSLVRDDPEHITIEVRAETPGYLTLADTYDPGWWATLDGAETPIRPAWIAFRAVFIPSGQHRVEFFYRPRGFTFGLILSLVGALLAIALIALPQRYPTAPEREVLAWSPRWPRRLGILLLILGVGSIVGIGSDGSVGLQKRWHRTLHPFTWGAGIEAMRNTGTP
ncbi:MAG: YfhO family protein [Isosphaeraceae bacterium]